MAWQASDFDATASAVKVKSEKMFKDVFHGSKRHDQIVKPVLETQKVDFREVTSGGRCLGVEVFRLGQFEEEYVAANHSETCNIDGAVTSVKKQTFQNNLEISVSGFVKDDDCPSLYSAIDKYMYIKKEAMTGLINELGMSIVSKLMLNTQSNMDPSTMLDYYPNDGIANGAGDIELYVDFEDKTVGHIYENALINEIDDPLILTGKNFYQSMLMSKFKTEGCCNMAMVYESDLFDWVFARKQIQSDTFVIDKGAIFFNSSNKYKNTIPIQLDGNTKAWREKLVGLQYNNGGKLQDIYLDVKSQRQCNNNIYGTAYQFILRGGIHCPINNVGYDNDSPYLSGILRYKKVARPA